MGDAVGGVGAGRFLRIFGVDSRELDEISCVDDSSEDGPRSETVSDDGDRYFDERTGGRGARPFLWRDIELILPLDP